MTEPLKPAEYVYDTYEINYSNETALDDSIKNDLKNYLDNLILGSIGKSIVSYYSDKSESGKYHYFYIGLLAEKKYYCEFTLSENGGNYYIDKCYAYRFNIDNLPSVTFYCITDSENGSIKDIGVFKTLINEEDNEILLMGYSSETSKQLIIPPKSFFIEGQHKNILTEEINEVF